MRQHDLWALRYWLWKLIRKQGRCNRYQTNKVIKRAIPSLSWAACKFINSGDIAELHHIDGNHDNWKLLNERG